jgi:hypothetical protein
MAQSTMPGQGRLGAGIDRPAAAPAYVIRVVAALLALGALLLPRPAWPGWAAGVLLGAAPLLGYLASRTIGVPGDSGDVGNWGDWVGTVSLFLEAGLLVLSIGMLLGGGRDHDRRRISHGHSPASSRAAAR